jgi:lysophospholipid acyltransferase (LPLAT)-like uncharacterized protein
MKIRLIDRLSGNGLALITYIVKKTCRFQYSHFEHLKEAFASGQTVIVTSWHGLTLMAIPMATLYQEPGSYVVLMPDDWRGASLKVYADRMGATPFMMNLAGDNTLGMGRQFVKLVRQVLRDKNLFINPDGPEGPSQVIKPGITFVAKKADAVILPIGAYTRHGYRVHRWDRYVVPYPFSRISYCFGEPYRIPPEMEDLTAADKHLTKILHRVTMQAAANYYEKRG